MSIFVSRIKVKLLQPAKTNFMDPEQFYTNARNHLEHIKDVLFVTGPMVNSPGLLHGKMGIAVFFSHYARYTNNEIYNDYASELITAIQSRLSGYNFTDYIHELSEIGIGIEYLLQNRYLEADSDEVLADFDSLLAGFLTDRYLYLSFDDVIDIGKYIVFRANSLQLNRPSKELTEKIIDLTDMHLTVQPVCLRSLTDLLYHFYCLYPSIKIKNMLNKQLHLLDLSLLKEDPLRWFYTFSQLSKYSDEYGLKCKEINGQIRKDRYSCFDLRSDSVARGKAGYIVCQTISGQGLNETGYSCLNSLIRPKDFFSADNSEHFLPDMGILNGYAGIGLTLLTVLDKHNPTWLKLL